MSREPNLPKYGKKSVIVVVCVVSWNVFQILLTLRHEMLARSQNCHLFHAHYLEYTQRVTAADYQGPLYKGVTWGVTVERLPAALGVRCIRVFVLYHKILSSFITRQTPHSALHHARTSSTSGHRSSTTHTPATKCTSNTPAATRSANIVGECDHTTLW